MHSRNRYFFLLAMLFVLPVSADEPAWVSESNTYAMELLEAQAKFSPEQAAQTGVSGFDEDIVDLGPGYVERSLAAADEVANTFRARIDQDIDPRVAQDLEIMIQSVDDQKRGAELQEQYFIPYFNVTQTVFFGIKGLLDPQIDSDRYPAAVVRLNKYTGLVDGAQPLTELAMTHTALGLTNPDLLGPYRKQLEQDIANSEQFTQGIRQMFEEFSVEGWEPAMAVFETQVQDYNTWLQAELLPRAEDSNQLPREVYEFNLRQFGLDVSPEWLIEQATREYMEIRYEMQALAPLIAERRGWDLTDYRDVIRELKKEQFVGEEILPEFNKVMASLDQLIENEQLVGIPSYPTVIRLASEAETAAIPAPHLQPARLIGNTGQRSEFVLPLNLPSDDGGSARMDDFTYPAASWTLAAHEARPGHELQFATMIDRGVSIARSLYAFNSVNVEGWALYAEAIVKPYLPLEGQLISLQARMQRAARAFLDPMVNLGTIEPEDVKAFIMKEVVLSDAMATSETNRYTFLAPGQATSYFYGYYRLMSLRAEVEIMLGEDFNEKALHDFILDQGLISPAMLRSAVLETFVPLQLAQT